MPKDEIFSVFFSSPVIVYRTFLRNIFPYCEEYFTEFLSPIWRKLMAATVLLDALQCFGFKTDH